MNKRSNVRQGKSYLNITYVTTIRTYQVQVCIAQAKRTVDTRIQLLRQIAGMTTSTYTLALDIKTSLMSLTLARHPSPFWMSGQGANVVFVDQRTLN